MHLSFAIHRLDAASRAGKLLAFLALASCFLWMDTECQPLGMSGNQLLLFRVAVEAPGSSARICEDFQLGDSGAWACGGTWKEAQKLFNLRLIK